jgi:hypothetical protein
MNREEIDDTVALIRAAGRTKILVCVNEWREWKLAKDEKLKPTKLPTIKSRHAILDVTVGRKKLAKMLAANPGERIPVMILGFVTEQHGSDDGESIEFAVDVDIVRIGAEDHPVATKTIGKAKVKTDANGKVRLSVPDVTPAHFKMAKRAKASRKAAGLVKNREAKR